MNEKKYYEISKGNKIDFERTEGGEIIKIRNKT